MVVAFVDDGLLGFRFRGKVFAIEVNRSVMEYALYITGFGALIVGFLLYRHRKVRKPLDPTYSFWAFPEGCDPEYEGIEFFCRRRPTERVL